MAARKSQTATEYIILLAVVIIVALIVAGVLGFIPGLGGSTASKAGLSFKESIGIVDAKFGTIGTTLTLRNIGTQSIMITRASFIRTGANFEKDLPVTLLPGQSVTVESYSQHTYTAGENVKDYLNITWRQTQAGVNFTVNKEDSRLQVSGLVAQGSVLRKNSTIVFVSSQTYAGDLGYSSGTSANTKCAQLAAAAGYGAYPHSKKWTAWLSGGGGTVSQMINNIQIPIRLVNGGLVGYNLSDIMTSKAGTYLRAPIDANEYGQGYTGYVWSNINATGYIDTGTECNQWALTDGWVNGAVGLAGETNSDWSQYDVSSCADEYPIYCFENY